MHNKLTIVSDTAIYKYQDKFYAFGPVVRELEFIDDLFDQITWIGYNRIDKLNDLSMQVINSKKIKVVLLNNIGGKGVFSFLKIIFNYPIMFYVILKNIYNSNIVHTRAPSHPALIAILISFLFRKKVWWNKFAGNWNQTNPPYSYGLQRFFLKKATFSKVTINGFWKDQLSHCFSFENPSLTEKDIENGLKIAQNKNFTAPFVFTFVGRLETPKGVDRIIEAFRLMPVEKIKEIHFIGDGDKTRHYIEQSNFLRDKVKFHGFLSKEKIHQILSNSHFFVLPTTASEGFPKVIAEAACYGVIPIVSNVSSIPHYINEKNGFIWDIYNNNQYSEILFKATLFDINELNEKSENVLNVAKLFTFNNYKNKLKKLVLNNSDNE